MSTGAKPPVVDLSVRKGPARFPVSDKNVAEAIDLARLLRHYRGEFGGFVDGAVALGLPKRFRAIRPEIEDLMRQCSALVEQGGLPFAAFIELALALADFQVAYEGAIHQVKNKP